MVRTVTFQSYRPMTRTRQTGAAAFKALFGMFFIGTAGHAQLAYLPVAGPPPLRVAAAKPSAAASIIALEKSAANSLTNLPPVLTTKPLEANRTNCFSADTNAPLTEPLIGVSPSTPAADTFAVPVFNLPSSSTMSMTPQLLATYFRPINVGTNGAAVIGAVPIGFVPPFTDPDKSSRAEYIVK